MVYTINNKEYLLFEGIFGDKPSGVKFLNRVKKYKGIVQYGGIDRGGLWGTTFVVCRVLIPSESAVEFSNEENDL